MHKIIFVFALSLLSGLSTDAIYDNSYALIIGIDDYHNVQGLDYAVKDAQDIKSMLIDKFNFAEENITLLKNDAATKNSIIQEFSNITNKAEGNDRVLIFFAGHGKTEDLPDGGEIGYLLPVDGDANNLYISAIDMDQIQKMSMRSEAKHILYLIDACYGGIASVVATRGVLSTEIPNYLEKITQYKSRQIISAGGRSDQVIEKAEWGHSAFTKNILSGLRDWRADSDDDGIITAQELGSYLKKKVTIDSNNQQSPKFRNLTSDEGEFIFSNYEIVSTNNDEIEIPITNIIDEGTGNINLGLKVKGTSVHLVTFIDLMGFGADYETFIDEEGKTSVIISNDLTFYVSHGHENPYSTEFANVIGINYRKYFQPFGATFIGFGLSAPMLTSNIYNTSESATHYGINPTFNFGYITSGDFALETTIQLGYLFVPKSDIPETSYKPLPQGFNLVFKFGWYKRKYSENTVILPE